MSVTDHSSAIQTQEGAIFTNSNSNQSINYKIPAHGSNIRHPLVTNRCILHDFSTMRTVFPRRQSDDKYHYVFVKANPESLRNQCQQELHTADQYLKEKFALITSTIHQIHGEIILDQ